MKEKDDDLGDLLVINKGDSLESLLPPNSTEYRYKNEFSKYLKATLIKEIDVQSQINKLDNLPCCLNEFLEEIMDNPNGLSQLLEIRLRNHKIKMSKTMNDIMVCQWCNDNCLKYTFTQEQEIEFSETNSKVCACSVESHDIFHYKNSLKVNIDEVKEIKKIVDLKNEVLNNELKNQLIKKKIEALIESKDDEKILQIISYMLSNDDLKTFFHQLKYNDPLFIKAFTALKNYKGQLNFDNFMLFYCRTYIFQNLDLSESPTFIFNLEFPFSDYVPSLYYANPDFYTQSFYSQVYRKNIMLQFLKSDEVFQFLQNLDIDYNFICSHLLNANSVPQEIFSFGFISLDYILQKFKGNELSNFKQNIGLNIIYIFINQICEIFSDFIQNGSTKSKSLLDKSNEFGKFLLEKIFEGTAFFVNPRIRIGRTFKCLILSYPLLRFRFIEENNQRILTLLSS